MSQKQSRQPLNPEDLHQLSKDQLVEIILTQYKLIEELRVETEKLKLSRNLDSQTSSKPPSTDLLKKSEKAKTTEDDKDKKRKPGGQPGHKGKTRKGFGRVDRIETLQPSICGHCGQTELLGEPVKVDSRQVAQLVDRPIEVVEYHRHHCQCAKCGQITSASWSSKMIPGQDLGVKLQGFLGWLGNYGHLPYKKQQEMLWELGKIEIGVGTIVATNQRVETAINPSVEQLSQWVKLEQPAILKRPGQSKESKNGCGCLPIKICVCFGLVILEAGLNLKHSWVVNMVVF